MLTIYIFLSLELLWFSCLEDFYSLAESLEPFARLFDDVAIKYILKKVRIDFQKLISVGYYKK
jgi:hypothetical protein